VESCPTGTLNVRGRRANFLVDDVVGESRKVDRTLPVHAIEEVTASRISPFSGNEKIDEVDSSNNSLRREFPQPFLEQAFRRSPTLRIGSG
jgi:hypothetical protein